MTEANRMLNRRWTRKEAGVLAAVCLLAGIAGGWLMRGPQAVAGKAAPITATAPAPNEAGSSSASQPPSPAEMKEMADAQAAPMLEKLKADPNNPGLLASIGNLYYDAQQYPVAVDYYGRALKLRPSDAAVRTDMGTAYWYMGKADEAIAEFDRALSYEPNNPNTLFNRGLVKQQGKKDIAGAIADWEKLLAVSPAYEARDKVKQMIVEAKRSQVKP